MEADNVVVFCHWNKSWLCCFLSATKKTTDLENSEVVSLRNLENSEVVSLEEEEKKMLVCGCNQEKSETAPSYMVALLIAQLVLGQKLLVFLAHKELPVPASISSYFSQQSTEIAYLQNPICIGRFSAARECEPFLFFFVFVWQERSCKPLTESAANFGF
jgi:hypothetical protein